MKVPSAASARRGTTVFESNSVRTVQLPRVGHIGLRKHAGGIDARAPGSRALIERASSAGAKCQTSMAGGGADVGSSPHAARNRSTHRVKTKRIAAVNRPDGTRD